MPKVKRGRGHPYAQVPLALQDDPDIDGNAIATYAALKRYADFGAEKGAYASHATLAAKAGVSEKTLRRRLARLRVKGWIDWVSGQTTNDYVVHGFLIPLGHRDRVDLVTETDCTRSQGPTTNTPPTLPTKPTPAPPIAGAGENGTTWMTPFMDLHLEVLEGKMNGGRWVRVFRPLLDEHGEAEVLGVQRHYLENLKATGRGDFLDYNKMAESFGTWLAPQQKAGRPTRRIRGKDFDA
jgi:hypothetical protein